MRAATTSESFIVGCWDWSWWIGLDELGLVGDDDDRRVLLYRVVMQ